MASRKIQKIEFNKFTLTITVVGILCVIFYCYVFYQTYQSNRTLISLMIIPLVLGIIFENKRLSTDWITIILKIFVALFLSVIVFIPGKRERHYNFENHIEIWPYWFVSLFVFISMVYHEKKIIPKLTEGITLLQSISIIYWIIDIGIQNLKNVFGYFLIGVCIISSILSFIHAFSYIKLTRNARLILSIWSSVIMIVFAIDHIYRVFNFNHFVEYKMLNDSINILQYFLLGVSLIYIFQNAFMLIIYFPDRNSLYGKRHMQTIRKMNETHIARYSGNQIKISDALMVLIFTTGIYYMNYTYRIMPRHTIIWLMFWSLPFVIWFKDLLVEKNKN